MVHPEGLTRREMYGKIAEHFRVVPGAWLKLDDENVALSCPQVIPNGTYTFSYVDDLRPDEECLGMSQEDTAEANMPCMTISEYLLGTAFNKFLRNEFWDLYSETVLAEYWNYFGTHAGMVYGFHQHKGRNPTGHEPYGYDGICLFNGPPKARGEKCGPRKVLRQALSSARDAEVA